MRTAVAELLSKELGRRGWTVAELLAKSGLRCTRSALQRKLKGQLRLNADEIEALASAFGIEITFRPQGRQKSKAVA